MYSKMQQPELALDIYRVMLRQSIRPDVATFTTIIDSMSIESRSFD